MAIFRYEAADLNGKILRGAMDATSAQEVSLRLTERGYRYIQVQGASAASSAAVASRASSVVMGVPTVSRGIAFGSPRPQEIALFFRQMASLVHAGFSVSAALGDLAPRTAHRRLSRAAFEMAQATGNGSSIAGQMVQHPELFAAHVVGLVAAGETGGFLEFSFEEVALGAEQDAALRQGLWLPKLLIWNAVWTVLLMQPLFPGIDTHKLSNGAVLSSFGGYIHALVFIAIPLGIFLHIAAQVVGWMRHQPFARDFFDAVSLRLPTMARLAKMRALASFTRVLRRLLMAGISPEPAFVGAVNSVPNAVLRTRMNQGVPIIRAAQGIDAAIQATGLMEHDPLQMLVTGQKTGQWIEMLDQVTAYYQEEAARATQDAKNAQKRLGVLLTIITTGYVLCVSTWGIYRIVFRVADDFAK